MNFVYCQNCFKKTEQNAEIVKFCAHCGKSFIASSNTNAIQHTSPNATNYKQLLAKRGISEIDDEDENDDSNNIDEDISVPHIKKLQLDVEIPQERGLPIRSVAKNTKRTPKPEAPENKRTNFNKKQFWEQYSKEASSIRKK